MDYVLESVQNVPTDEWWGDEDNETNELNIEFGVLAFPCQYAYNIRKVKSPLIFKSETTFFIRVATLMIKSYAGGVRNLLTV